VLVGVRVAYGQKWEFGWGTVVEQRVQSSQKFSNGGGPIFVDVSMAEIVLDPPCIVPIRGKTVPAGMSQLMRPDDKRDVATFLKGVR